MPPMKAFGAPFSVRIKFVRITVDVIRIRNSAGACTAWARFLEIEFVEIGIAQTLPADQEAGISLRTGAETWASR